MKIEFSLDQDSIRAAIEQVGKCRDHLQDKMHLVCERLAQVGVEVLRTTYANAIYAGDNDIEVDVEFTDNGAVILAHGDALGFIEFGAGINYPLGEYANQAGAPGHGSYGKGHGATGKMWAYDGERGTSGIPIRGRSGIYRTDGNPPANAFPAAMRAMQEQVRGIVREVFNS